MHQSTWTEREATNSIEMLEAGGLSLLVEHYEKCFHLRWYVPQNIPKILFTGGGESSIVSDCTRE